MEGQCTISCKNILLWIFLACRMNSFLGDCVVTSSYLVCVMRPIHTCGFTGPQEKLHKKIGRLEGFRRTYTMSIQSVSCIVWLQREQDSLRADSFCNLNKISTCMIIQSWGFRLVLSPVIYLLCYGWLLLNLSYICSCMTIHISI